MKTILILEDEAVLAGIYRKNLEAVGYHVVCAESVDEASKYLLDHEIDLALLDHGIRGEDEAGLDFVPKLRKSFPNIKVVMLSNYDSLAIKEEAEKVGVDDYLVKLNTPPKDLVEYVKKLFV